MNGIDGWDSTSNCFIVIPARLQSTRLPRKMLLRETGKSLLQHTFEAASKARKAAGVCVATDHGDIESEVRAEELKKMLEKPGDLEDLYSVVEETKGPKINGFVYKNKSNIRKRWGHRSALSRIEI